jgi:DnaK suppressor protein
MSIVLTGPTTTAVPIDLQRYRTVLEDLRAGAVRERELALAESATAMPDAVAVSRAARLLGTVEEIDSALQRIADGSYGTCMRCGAGIAVERLEFRPYAPRCVTCEGRTR